MMNSSPSPIDESHRRSPAPSGPEPSGPAPSGRAGTRPWEGGPAAEEPAVIEFSDVSLRFRRYGELRPTLKATVVQRMFRRKYKTVSDFTIFNGLNLTIRSGDRLGIVGHNGAGKSTMLKMIAGIYRPSVGRIRVRGKVAPLIELGAGFNPELSGIENIFLNGALLGFSQPQMAAKVDTILDFSGLREHANTPVKYYSSGMVMRLAFSIATDIDPEILLLDEIFAAGDLEFLSRAQERMHRLIETSHILVLVSHSLELIEKNCSRCIWIDHGRIVMDADPKAVCEAYRQGPGSLAAPPTVVPALAGPPVAPPSTPAPTPAPPAVSPASH